MSPFPHGKCSSCHPSRGPALTTPSVTRQPSPSLTRCHAAFCATHLSTPLSTMTPHVWVLFLVVEPGISFHHKPSAKVALSRIVTWKTTELVLILARSLSHRVVSGTLLISSKLQFARFPIREMMQRV